ncbi:MAG: hypothetical protein M3Z30_07810 [Gemmatimonadota bacterium]|nr:hypothetical protein [Gemmatimonadota bacterium]
MSATLNPARASLGGTSIVMACACATASSSVKLLALVGIGTATTLIHPLLFGVGAALIFYGLWRTDRNSAYMALAAFAVLAIAAWITPPAVMNIKGGMASESGGMVQMNNPGVPWNNIHLFGASLYVLGAAILGYAFWRAFPSRKPSASALAIGGVTLATGCTCCLVDGAIAGMAVTAGASAAFESTPMIYWSALGAVAIGLYRLGGLRAAMWVPIGGAIVKYAPSALKLTGDWMVGGVNLRFAPNYLLTIIGSAVILYGFVVAYRAVPVAARESAEIPLTA